VPAVIRLDFDPTVNWLGLTVRLETVAIAGAIFIAFVLAGICAGRTQARLDRLEGNDDSGQPRLRRDDLILIAFGAIPGAVVGGRLGYGLIHLDYYLANPASLADPSQGGLALALGLLLGVLGGIGVARLLAAPVGRWLHVLSVPLLVGLGLGKLAMVLGGAGQGQYSAVSWATVYVRPGPWDSANPGVPALPSQALEGGLVLLAALLIVVVPAIARFRLRRWRRIVRPGWAPRRDWIVLTGGRRFVTALGLWAVARILAAFTWRDAQILGPLRAEQLVLLVLIGTCLAWFGVRGLNRRVRLRHAKREARKAREVLDVEKPAPEPDRAAPATRIVLVAMAVPEPDRAALGTKAVPAMKAALGAKAAPATTAERNAKAAPATTAERNAKAAPEADRPEPPGT
jgi:prolipoprotein diacylglyceryltransferase